MDIQATSQQVEMGMLKGALETQKLGASLITSTVDRLNSGMVGMTPVVKSDYAMQKAVLNAAYTERGIGTNLDLMI